MYIFSSGPLYWLRVAMSFCSDHVFWLHYCKSSVVTLPGASDTRGLWLNIQDTRKQWQIICEDRGTLSDQGQGSSVKLTKTTWKAKIRGTGQEVRCLCKKRRFITVFRRARDRTAILSQIGLCNIRFNIVFSSHLGPPNAFFPAVFPTTVIYVRLSFTTCALHVSVVSWSLVHIVSTLIMLKIPVDIGTGGNGNKSLISLL
jgi:hypothetical protein